MTIDLPDDLVTEYRRLVVERRTLWHAVYKARSVGDEAVAQSMAQWNQNTLALARVKMKIEETMDAQIGIDLQP
jgi:hypothetical protein